MPGLSGLSGLSGPSGEFGVAIHYLLRDEFNTARVAGSVNGTAAEPGGTGGSALNTRTVVDTGNNVSISGGELVVVGKNSWGDPYLHYGGVSRSAGILLLFKVIPGASSNSAAIGFVTSLVPANQYFVEGIFLSNGNNLIAMQTNTTVGSYVVGQIYYGAVVLRSTGDYIFVKPPSDNWLLYKIIRTNNTATVYPGVIAYANGVTTRIDFFRMPEDLYVIDYLAYDTFTRPNGALGNTETTGPESQDVTARTWTGQVGTWGVSGNKAQASALAGGLAVATCPGAIADAYISVALTRAGGNVGGIARWTDANNYLRFYHDGANAVLDEVVAGVPNTLITGVKAYAANKYIELILNGQSARLIYNDSSIGTTAVINAALTGTTHGLYTTNTGNTMDGFEVVASGAGAEYWDLTQYNGSEASTLTVTSPSAYQVFQRDGSDQADIVVVGTYYSHQPTAVEARFDGGAWQTIASASPGAFNGVISNCDAGQGTVEVRLAESPGTSATIENVGIGDVFIVAGQSNASGKGTNNQSYSHATLKAGLFGNDYEWKELADPTDDNTGQVDAVSSDAGAGGSVWPLLATSILADQGVPVAFVPCAKGSTSITAWQPGVDHSDRTTLYGSMNYRATTVHGVKAVLWWQGEADATAGMSAANYNNYLDTLANAIAADQGVTLVACKFQNCTGIPDAQETQIYNGIATAWGDNPNVDQGPDLSGLTSDDAVHLTSNANLAAAAALWWAALQAVFYP